MPEGILIPIDEMKRYLPYAGAFHTVRNSFWGAGQDSFTLPPAQNEDLFMKLTNVHPIMKGTIERRWGYNLFGSVPGGTTIDSGLPYRFLYRYVNEKLNIQKLIFIPFYNGVAGSANPTLVFNEDGTFFQNLSGVKGANVPLRGVNSRDYFFFTPYPNVQISNSPPLVTTSGVTGSGNKWDGTSNPITTWGYGAPLQAPTLSVLSNNSNSVVGQVIATGNNTARVKGTLASTPVIAGTLTVTFYQTNYPFNPITATDNGVGGFNAPKDANGNVFLALVGDSSVNYTTGAVFLHSTSYPFTSGTNITASYTTSGTVVNPQITLTVGRKYFQVYSSTKSGNVSDLSPVSLSTGPMTTQYVSVTVDNTDYTNAAGQIQSDFDTVNLLATADGGDETTLYFVTSGPLPATTTLIDNTPEATLLASNIYQQTDQFGNLIGCFGNQPPLNNMSIAIKHKGRLFGLVGQFLYFSKALPELTTSTGVIAGRYEEDWPPTYYLDISEGAESGRALLSDGNVLYIGSERRIRRLIGEGPGPGGLTPFARPEVLFNDVGVLNQEVWQVVFREGQPVGTIWMTPDFRVIESDMNTYKDIGHPIQDVLNTINTSAAQNAAIAMFAATGSYDLYILAFPTGSNLWCDTLLIYNMRTGMWVVWKLTDTVSGLLYNIPLSGIPQLLFSTASDPTNFYQLLSTLVQDKVGVNATGYPVTIQTSWLAHGDASLRKVLNEMEIISGDPPNLLVTVEGANLQADFANPILVVPASPIVQGPLGEWKLFLASAISRHRYYRYTFQMAAASTATNVLEGYSLETVPFHRV